MSVLRILGSVALVTIGGELPVFAQAAIQEPGAYAFYHPDAARGVRWDDPAFGIAWPARPAVISDRDAAYQDFDGSKGVS